MLRLARSSTLFGTEVGMAEAAVTPFGSPGAVFVVAGGPPPEVSETDPVAVVTTADGAAVEDADTELLVESVEAEVQPASSNPAANRAAMVLLLNGEVFIGAGP